MNEEYDWEMLIDMAYTGYCSEWKDPDKITVSPQSTIDIPLSGPFPFLKMAVARRYINENDIREYDNG